MTGFSNVENVKGLLSLLDHYSLLKHVEGEDSPFEYEETLSLVKTKGYGPAAKQLLDAVNKDPKEQKAIIQAFELQGVAGDSNRIKASHIWKKVLNSPAKREDLKAALIKADQITGLKPGTRKALKDLLRILDVISNDKTFAQGKRAGAKLYQGAFNKKGVGPAVKTSFDALTPEDKAELAKLFEIEGKITPRSLLDNVLIVPANDSDLRTAFCKIDPEECPKAETPPPLKHLDAEKLEAGELSEKDQKRLDEISARLKNDLKDDVLYEELKKSPEYFDLLAYTLLTHNYSKDTIVDIDYDFDTNENISFITLTLDGKRQGKGAGLSIKQALESALKKVEKNYMSDRSEFIQILSRVNRIQMPLALESRLYRTQLARTLRDMCYPEDTIVQIEISFEDDVNYLYLILDGKIFGPGASPFPDHAFVSALKKVEHITFYNREKFHQMLDRVEKVVLPDSLRDPILRTVLARTLLDKGYAANVRLGILGEKTGELYALHIYINSKKCSGALAHTPRAAFHLALEKLPEKD